MDEQTRRDSMTPWYSDNYSLVPLLRIKLAIVSDEKSYTFNRDIYRTRRNANERVHVCSSCAIILKRKKRFIISSNISSFLF